MTFLDALARFPFVFGEGSIIELLRRNSDVELDPWILNSGLVFQPENQREMEAIYRSYLEIGRAHGFPMMLLTPTWRANPERARLAGYSDTAGLNGRNAAFLQSLGKSMGAYGARVFIGGLMGPKNDAYDPRQALGIQEAFDFHQAQAGFLAKAGVDFLIAETLPAVSEAIGLALAMKDFGLPYFLGFVLRETGTLLDGTPLNQAIEKIDAAASPAPAGYLATCTHPAVFDAAMAALGAKMDPMRDRILGIAANTSSKSPEELDGLDRLDAQDPESFGEVLAKTAEKHGLKIIAGCCGASPDHMAQTAVWLDRVFT